MIPLRWKLRIDQPAAPYPNGGGNDPLSDDLGDLVGSYYVESHHAIGEFRAFRLYEDARTIDAIRVQYIRGEIDAQYASAWLAAGYKHLRDCITERASQCRA